MHTISYLSAKGLLQHIGNLVGLRAMNINASHPLSIPEREYQGPKVYLAQLRSMIDADLPPQP